MSFKILAKFREKENIYFIYFDLDNLFYLDNFPIRKGKHYKKDKGTVIPTW